MQAGETEAGRAEYRAAFALDPDWPRKVNQEARRRATDPKPDSLDGVLALRWAQQVCQATDNRTPEFLDTLALAYAGRGRFDEACAAAGQALPLAEAAGQPDLAEQIRQRLRRYEDHQAPVRTLP